MATKTDSQLATAAITIQNEVIVGANDEARVGGFLIELNENKINKDKIDTDADMAADLDTLIPSQKAVKAYADTKQVALVSGTNVKTINGDSILGAGDIAISGLSPFDIEELAVTGFNSTTATLISKRYTYAVRDTGNYVKLPANPAIGDVFYISNSGDSAGINALDLYVVRNGSQFMYNTGNPYSGLSSYRIGLPTACLYVFRYVEANKWFISIEPGFVPNSKVFVEYRARLFQIGTTAPSAQYVFINQINNGSIGESLYRAVSFSRTGVGDYKCRIRYGDGAVVNPGTVDLSFSDGKIIATAMTNGSDGISAFADFDFNSYTPAGVLADGVINYSNIYIRIY